MRYYIRKVTHWTTICNAAQVIISLLAHPNSEDECVRPFTRCCLPRGQILYMKSKEKSILKWRCVQRHTIKSNSVLFTVPT